MAVSLNLRAYAHARDLVKEERVVLDERRDWDVHRPTPEQENRFIEEHGYGEYGRWFLGVDDEHGEETKGHYKFPYGDFDRLHKCAVLSAEVRAAQYSYDDIEAAAAHLHGMLIALGE
ncbi:hypothetical protein DQ384_18740 [Sphaerisporangium album]|uniref:Uncharacterized protein n=1 Tax=Sphaerisporangium album TaxID=509200 RepID=A0A367FHI3_9ACTN|nr:hypothetical protein [Sphaerisporangium album]RCG29833.1 hypothetical protein DQ384_18740 [Sphaerisporangium album]